MTIEEEYYELRRHMIMSIDRLAHLIEFVREKAHKERKEALSLLKRQQVKTPSEEADLLKALLKMEISPEINHNIIIIGDPTPPGDRPVNHVPMTERKKV